jgi:hypothetical protein
MASFAECETRLVMRHHVCPRPLRDERSERVPVERESRLAPSQPFFLIAAYRCRTVLAVKYSTIHTLGSQTCSLRGNSIRP